MLIYFTAFLVSASIAAAMTPLSRLLAIHIGAVDEPDVRKVHRGSMPRMGGLAIILAFMLPVIGLLFIESPLHMLGDADDCRIIALLAGGLVIAAVGALDDIKGVGARNKFIVQILVALSVWLAGFHIQKTGLPFFGMVELPIWLDLPISVLWITGVINAINLTDGLDGLAAGVTFFVAITNLVLSVMTGNALGATFSAIIAGAVIGFLLFNWNPAIVFMGDTGSMFLGYILATTSIMTSQKVSTAVAMLVPVLALGVPVMDTLMSMVRRFLERRPIFSPDKGHLHHRLLRLGLNQKRAVLVIYGISILFAASAIGMTASQDIEAAVALFVLATVVIGIVRFFGFFNVSRAVSGMLPTNQLVERIRKGFPEFAGKVLNETKNVDEIWSALCELCSRTGMRDVSWKTAGLSPADERQFQCLTSEHPNYKKIAKKGFMNAKTATSIDSPGYLEVRYVYPATIGKIGMETETVLDMIGDTLGAGLRRLKAENAWRVEKVALKTDPSIRIPREVLEGHVEPEDPFADIESSEIPINPPDHPQLPADDWRLGEDIRNSALDAAWVEYVELCRDNGFAGAAWKTMGIRPADVREIVFDDLASDGHSMLKRSIPISTMAFVELKFFYQGTSGKKTPPPIRQSAGDIANAMTKRMVRLREALVK